MTTARVERKKRTSGSETGAAGVHFVCGELIRHGYLALPTVKNTPGIDILASDSSFKKSAYIQVKANKNRAEFWLVGKPVSGTNIFYVFVNLLANKGYVRPEYYIVPSAEVQAACDRFNTAKENNNPTGAQKEEIVRRIKNKETGFKIVYDLMVSISAVRKIAEENGNLKIMYDRRPANKNQGQDFAYSYYIRKTDEDRYRDQWERIFKDQ